MECPAPTLLQLEDATAVDALAQSWSGHITYMFPPFALVGRCLQKLHREKVEFVVMIALVWRAQHWCPVFLNALVDLPLALPAQTDLLVSCQQEPHPLIQNRHLNNGLYQEFSIGKRSSGGGTGHYLCLIAK